MVLPGFTDSHMHMLQYAMFHKNVDLVGVDSIETIIRLYKERMERDHPPYIIGMGWNQETMAEGRLVTKQDLTGYPPKSRFSPCAPASMSAPATQ